MSDRAIEAQEETGVVLAIIDDDALRDDISKAFNKRDIPNLTVKALSDLGFLGAVDSFDVLLLQYDSAPVSGHDLAIYIDTLFDDKSVVMIVKPGVGGEGCEHKPSCVKSYVAARFGSDLIGRIVNEFRLQQLERGPTYSPRLPLTV